MSVVANWLSIVTCPIRVTFGNVEVTSGCMSSLLIELALMRTMTTLRRVVTTLSWVGSLLYVT